MATAFEIYQAFRDFEEAAEAYGRTLDKNWYEDAMSRDVRALELERRFSAFAKLLREPPTGDAP